MDFSLQSLSSFISSLPGGETLWMILMFIVVLSILVFFHELGHYLAARSVGIRVTTFSIGFGKELFGWNDKHGTRWKVSLIPLGGYVQMFGDESVDSFSEEDKKEAFLSKNVWQRIWVVFAGPFANFVLAVVFLTALMFSGEEVSSPAIGQIVENSAASTVDLKSGDIILTIDGQGVNQWGDIVTAIASSEGREMLITYERDTRMHSIKVTPNVEERTNIMGEKVVVAFLGIAPSGDVYIQDHTFSESLVLGVTKTYDLSARILDGIGKIFTGSVSAKNIGGPVMIAEIAGKAGNQGWYSLIMFMVIISINLGLINLFPIPVLDGGHLLFYIIEALRGKPLGEKTQEVGYRVGYSLIMLLMIFAIGNDIMRVAGKFMTDDPVVIETKK